MRNPAHDPDPTDHAIEALVALREYGLPPSEVQQMVRDVYTAPWSDAMTKRDRAALKTFNRLVARLALLERRRYVSYNSLMAATRILEKIAALRDTSGPAVRRQMRLRMELKAAR